MKDIVEKALDHREHREGDETTDGNEFGEPQLWLIGYGDDSAQLIEQGWDSRYPHPKYPDVDSCHINNIEELPEAATAADYVILAGSTEDESVAEAIGDALADDTTSIAISLPTGDTPTNTIGSVNTTIACNPDYVQELATDVLTILTGRIEISPPTQFYDTLQTTRQLHGFRGQQSRDDSEGSPDQFAAQLVTDTLSKPLAIGGNTKTEHVLSFLHAGEDLTLREATTIRTELATNLDGGSERALLAVDATPEMKGTFRLTTLCQSPVGLRKRVDAD